MTTIVNIQDATYDVYIGRKGRGEEGYFGNPFTLQQYPDRRTLLLVYRRWFWNRVNEDIEYRERVMGLKGLVLGCFCKPAECHGDVIKAWLDAGSPLKEAR